MRPLICERKLDGTLHELRAGEMMNAGKQEIPMTLEVVVIPVADVDRSVRFYQRMGWRLDADYEAGPEYRVVQLTPPGSKCSIQFGRGVTSVAPGSAQGMCLVVYDIDRTRVELASVGIDVSDIFHRVYDSGVQEQVDGPDRNSLNYHSFATFSDPDGNVWLLQQVQEHLAGR
ncbi:VOC family protein [Streptomyces sp. NPDC048643]|uniref:VOC family protein n=1 Tax=Streptomyces sp. NPDC048643 TaxID=3155637 RepID=UPI00342FBBF7